MAEQVDSTDKAVNTPRPLRTWDAFLGRIEWAGSVLSAFFLLAIMCLVTVSGISRYLFASPIVGSQAWVGGVLAPAVAFLAASEALRNRRHIGVTILVTKMSPKLRLATQTFAGAATVMAFAMVAYQGALRALSAFNTGQLHPEILVPLWLIYSVVPVGSVLLILRTLTLMATWWTGNREAACLAQVDYSDASSTTE